MSMPAAPPVAAICGAPLSAASLARQPEIHIASLRPDDRGRPELILRVARQGDRFCYRYTLDGVEENVAPILIVRRGERFDMRVVNELRGPAKGETMAASAIPPCSPASMMMTQPRAFSGYLNHTLYERSARMPDVDVNMHLHGFEGPALQENVFLSTLSTPAHACEYDITIPRTQPPGTYFYHPHAHMMSDDEVAGGLAGMWIVEPDTPQLPPADEHAVILRYRVPFVSDNPYMPSTALLGVAGAIHEARMKPASPLSYDPFEPPAWPSAYPMSAGGQSLNGCGNFDTPLISVNGVDAPARLTVPSGEPQLLRILNATSDSAKYLRLRDAAGHVRALEIVARDGVPVGGDDAHPLARYELMNSVMLVPTGRLDVLLTLKPGEALTLYSDERCLAPIDEYRLKHDLLTIAAGDPAAQPPTVASAPLTADESPAVRLLRWARAHAALVRRRAITYTEYAFPKAGKRGAHPEFYITETSNKNFHEQPFWPMYGKGQVAPPADIVVKRGTVEEWYLFNATMEVHTFHIHQMAFVAEDESPMPTMLDTVLVRMGKLLPNKAEPDYPLVKPGLTRVLLDFRNVPRGTFVFHCHMLFHEDRGMMGVIRVE